MFLVLLCSCTQTHYADITGQGRGQPQFDMDSANCDLLRQSVPAPAMYNNCPTCNTLSLTGTLIQQNTVYNDCLTARGWEVEQ